jgi:hypothetical protein
VYADCILIQRLNFGPVFFLLFLFKKAARRLDSVSALREKSYSGPVDRTGLTPRRQKKQNHDIKTKHNGGLTE